MLTYGLGASTKCKTISKNNLNIMSNNNFGKRKRNQSFRPAGGMRDKVLKKESAEKGREDIENSRLLNEPVYERSREAEILKAYLPEKLSEEGVRHCRGTQTQN